MGELILKSGEVVIPIEKLKSVELGENDTLIIELPEHTQASREALMKIQEDVSCITGGKTLVLSCGLTAKVIIKSGKRS